MSSKYSGSSSGKGLKLWNFAFPSYDFRSGSAYSHLIVPVPGTLNENAFVEFKYNLFTMPRYYKGFYLTIVRADRGAAVDMFTMNLEACPDATLATVSSKCSPITFYRCYLFTFNLALMWSEFVMIRILNLLRIGPKVEVFAMSDDSRVMVRGCQRMSRSSVSSVRNTVLLEECSPGQCFCSLEYMAITMVRSEILRCIWMTSELVNAL